MNDKLQANLSQRGRAMIDFYAHMFRGTQNLRDDMDDALANIAPDPSELPDDLYALNETLETAMEKEPSFRVNGLIGEWHSRNHGIACEEAFELVRDKIEPVLRDLDNGPATLEADPDFKAPPYWSNVEFHRTSGGWDGHEFQGYIHGEIVHRKMVDALYPGGIFKQRRAVAAMAPKDSYGRILELGCSTGHFTEALAETYPDAEIYGVDLSIKTLEHARRVANANNWAWKLFQRPAENTRFDAGSFDLVASYILLHEIPAKVVRAVFEEAFRTLKPGGDMIMSDVTRYADMDKLRVWKADHGAKYGGEPHWRASASLDLGAVATQAGFENVKAESLGPGGYPYVVMARKPE